MRDTKQCIVLENIQDENFKFLFRLQNFLHLIVGQREVSFVPSSVDVVQYRKKVMAFLNAQREHPAILKLRFNEPVTPSDVQALEKLLYELGGEGSQEKFERTYGKPVNLGTFIRKLVGLDREAAKKAFGKYLAGTQYNAAQIRFVNQIIEYLTQNGVMDGGLLYAQPFTNFSPLGLVGMFPETEAADIVQILALINRNAGAGGQYSIYAV